MPPVHPLSAAPMTAHAAAAPRIGSITVTGLVVIRGTSRPRHHLVPAASPPSRKPPDADGPTSVLALCHAAKCREYRLGQRSCASTGATQKLLVEPCQNESRRHGGNGSRSMRIQSPSDRPRWTKAVIDGRRIASKSTPSGRSVRRLLHQAVSRPDEDLAPASADVPLGTPRCQGLSRGDPGRTGAAGPHEGQASSVPSALSKRVSWECAPCQ
jgi:hypothetical protein